VENATIQGILPGAGHPAPIPSGKAGRVEKRSRRIVLDGRQGTLKTAPDGEGEKTVEIREKP